MLQVGEMISNDGKNNKEEQIISPEALDYIFDGTDLNRDQFRNSAESNLNAISGNIYNMYDCAFNTASGHCSNNT